MIRLVCLGKNKPLYKTGVDEFTKRLSKYCKFELLESSSSKESKNQGNLKGTIVALDEGGKEFTSQQFSKFMQKLNMESKDITFVIGPAEGLSKEIKDKANHTISLSKMTMPNQMAKLVFLEQLYRAFTIIKGSHIIRIEKIRLLLL
jgi:23S rRNA (pseudouridine1915-N3)-methyltransferase